MTSAQRSATIEMMHAILAVKAAPHDIRFRAENLLGKLNSASIDDMMSDIMRKFRG